jgi:hypothetical protein
MVGDTLDFLLLYGLMYKAVIIDRWRNVWWASTCFYSALIDGLNKLVVVARALLLVLLVLLLMLVLVVLVVLVLVQVVLVTI